MEKHLWNFLAACMMTSAAFAATPQLEVNTEKPDSAFHIYLCFGQSNMEGNAEIEDVDKKNVDERFQVMSVCDVDREELNRIPGEWYTAVPPLCRAGTKLGVTDYFGRTMVEYLPDSCRIGVVMVAIGGTGIECYDKEGYADYYATTDDYQRFLMDLYGGSPYAKLVEMGKKAQKDGIIKGILLHQGETNNMQPDWPMKVRKIYHDLLRDLALDEKKVPLFAGELVSAAEGGVCAGHNEYIAMLPDLMNAYVISSEGCEGAADRLHFTAEGYREMGRRYAQAVLNNVYGIPAGMPEQPVVELSTEKEQEAQIGTGRQLELMATFSDGQTMNIASMARYEISDPEVANISNGRIRGLIQGQTEVKATYSDREGHTFSTSFTVRSTCFPFGEDFINTTLFGNGTYREAAKAFFPGQNGQMGWKYTYGLDMSGYKYLVVKLDKVQKVGAQVMLYPENNIWNNCHAHPIGDNTTVVIPLQEITYTSGDQTGQPVDLTRIMIVAFYAGQGGVIDVADMYLTNNEDHSPDAVPSVFGIADTEGADNAVYNLQGVRMTGRSSLTKGIYIRNGKKFVVR